LCDRNAHKRVFVIYIIIYKFKRWKAKRIGLLVLSFCLDTKAPKSQDLYKNGLGSRPLLLKFRNSLRSNSRNFFTQEWPASTLRDGNFYKGRKLREQGPERIRRSSSFPGFRSFWPFWKKTVRGMEKSQLTLRNPFCLSVASLTDFSKVTFSKSFGRLGLAFLVLLLR
jgi:hypothetical protein